MADRMLVEAVRMALARVMSEDETVILLGEDIGRNGGVFRATNGLLERFGEQRVRDTPIAEAAIAGLAVGLAAQGMRPVAEIQFSGFIYPCIDQLTNHASRLRTRTRGRLTCPLVIRSPSGGGIHAPEHHSESMEALLTNVPGLRVVFPSSPKRAYGLLLSAIRGPDPVVFFEPTRLYRSAKEDVDDSGEGLPLNCCFTLREGTDVTLVTWGATVIEALAAGDHAADEGVSVELIDVAILKPLDFETIRASVSKTGRAVIVHEAPISGGFGAEIAERIADEALLSLLAPVKRVAGYDVVMPLPRLEQFYLPDEPRIMAAIRDVMSYT